MPDLKALRANREEILKAELFMLLHDVGKLHAGHQSKYIVNMKSNDYFHAHLGRYISEACPDISSKLPPSIAKQMIRYPKQRPSNEFFQASLAQVIGCHHRPRRNEELQNKWNHLSPLIRLVAFVDWLDSEYDREDVSDSQICRPTRYGFGVFTAFGKERFLYSLNEEVSKERNSEFSYNDPDFPNAFLLKNVLSLIYSHIRELLHSTRKNFLLILRLLFERAAGDTRHSVNDISLWEHSWSTAQLYKSLLADGFLNNRGLTTLMGKFSKRQYNPQLLPLRIDGLAYLSQSNNVPDLLARRALLQKVYDTWQDILEWEFPLAGEVYRDENGPVFLTFLRDEQGKNALPFHRLVLPKDEKAPVLQNAYKQSKNLEEYLRQTIIHLTHGDLTIPPEIKLFTYSQKRSGDGKSLGDLLREELEKGLRLQTDAQCVERSWQRVTRKSSKGEEICSVCGLRPQGFGRWYAVEISRAEDSEEDQKQEERRAKQKEALLEWLQHYQNKHRPLRRWEEKTEEERKCQVCKAISRGMCGVCLERREMRAKPWAYSVHLNPHERFQQGHPETVWLDEVADKHGRIALIVGYFPLENWLDGTLVESLSMFKQKQAEAPPTNRKITIYDATGKAVNVILGPKTVSYSRLRRVWETTRRFWQDVAPTDAPPKALQEILQGNKYGLTLEDLWEGPLSLKDSLAGQAINEKRPRIFFKGTLQKGSLDPYHAYELEIQGRKVAVLWVPQGAKDEKGNPLPYRGGFWVIENLDYLDNVYGRSFREIVQELAGQPLKVYEPTEYGRPGQEQATFTNARGTEVQYLKENYIPLIPILAEPRTFMALVPADKAFEAVKAIKAKYEREMGRVRNRLPLHLGIVFADSHQPLRTILDAGRKMLRQSAQPVAWKVTCLARKQATKGDSLPSRFKSDENGQFKEWYEVSLKAVDKKITWYVPAFMGDGETEDHWYPYVFLETSSEPADRKRYYKTDLSNPWNRKHPWLVHAGELKPEDRIYFTPATFDFIFLDHSGKRFEIAYDDKGLRLGASNRPYLLDQLEDLEACWSLLTNGKRRAQDQGKLAWRLSSRQIHQIRDAIEQKREEWFSSFKGSQDDDTFKRFCKDLLANAEWRAKPSDDELDRLAQWAVNGVLTDAIELFLHIMKQRESAAEQTKKGEAEG